MDRFAIIGGDIHRLRRFKKNEEWSNFPWRIHEKNDLYWVPINNEKKQLELGNWIWRPFEEKECESCRKRWYSHAARFCI